MIHFVEAIGGGLGKLEFETNNTAKPWDTEQRDFERDMDWRVPSKYPKYTNYFRHFPRSLFWADQKNLQLSLLDFVKYFKASVNSNNLFRQANNSSENWKDKCDSSFCLTPVTGFSGHEQPNLSFEDSLSSTENGIDGT